MPYVNCPKCKVRSFALAPWSTVTQCPICDTPLSVRRQSASAEESAALRWPQTRAADEDTATAGTLETG